MRAVRGLGKGEVKRVGMLLPLAHSGGSHVNSRCLGASRESRDSCFEQESEALSYTFLGHVVT